MNDRQRVEASIIPFLIFGICKPMEDLQETDDQKEKHRKIVEASFSAIVEPASDLDDRRAGQIYRRAEREYLALANVLEGTSNAQAMMSVYYLLEELLQEERLTIYEDSYFGESLNVYMDAIQHYFELEKLDAAAQKRARKLRETLKKNGYFK